jgi:hypothetical protein
MQNLFFTLASHRKLGLSFVTHRGSSICLQPGCSAKMPILDDEPMTTEELVSYYDYRYKRDGLLTRILDNSPAVNGTSIKDIEASTNTKEEQVAPSTVAPIDEVKAPAAEDEVKAPAAEDEVKAPAAEDEVKAPAAEDEVKAESVADWSFDKMKDFVKENEIELNGRSKADYIAAIEEFLKKED